MQDILDIITNVNTIYSTNNALAILKDFERVIDELDLYVYANWEDGELAAGPSISRHWVTCAFMWPYDKMPDPAAAQRLSEFGCEVKYKRDTLIKPRKIRTPDDIRPNSKKGKIDEFPIWIVEIQMPKRLMLEVYRGFHAELQDDPELPVASANEVAAAPAEQPVAQPVQGPTNATQ